MRTQRTQRTQTSAVGRSTHTALIIYPNALESECYHFGINAKFVRTLQECADSQGEEA